MSCVTQYLHAQIKVKIKQMPLVILDFDNQLIRVTAAVITTRQHLLHIKPHLSASWDMFSQLHFGKISLANGFYQSVFSNVRFIRSSPRG